MERKMGDRELELMLENVMRGGVARLGQLAEVIFINVGFNSLAVVMSLFSVYLVAVVRTPQAYHFAPYVIAGTLAVTAAKGGALLHRKWGEYNSAERASQQASILAWKNPSVEVRPESRKSVLIANLLAVAAMILPVLLYSYYEIFQCWKPNVIGGVAMIVPSVLMIITSLWAWLAASSK
jgi:hypothetical protein